MRRLCLHGPRLAMRSLLLAAPTLTATERVRDSAAERPGADGGRHLSPRWMTYAQARSAVTGAADGLDGPGSQIKGAVTDPGAGGQLAALPVPAPSPDG